MLNCVPVIRKLSDFFVAWQLALQIWFFFPSSSFFAKMYDESYVLTLNDTVSLSLWQSSRF